MRPLFRFERVCRRFIEELFRTANLDVTESRIVQAVSRRSRMGDDEDEEPVDPKAPLTEECMKTRTCARLLVSGESCAHTPSSPVV